MTQSLDGIRILDLTRLLPGAVCTLMLADMGAEIIKVEDPNGGDYARWMSPTVNGQGVFFGVSNRNKRSVIIDLKQAQGQAVFHKLAAAADVIIEGFRPGVMAKLGCDYPALHAVNPRLVYCSLSGWGANGPYAQRSGHDINYLAVAGLLGAVRTPAVLGGQVADLSGTYTAVAGILAALLKRERGGEGNFVDVSLFESAFPFMFQPWVETVTRHLSDSAPDEGSLTGGLACYNVYKARDGRYVTLGALEPKFWANFCNAVERADLISDYLTPARQGYLRVELAELFALRPAAEWDSLLGRADCCFAVVNTPAETADDPHVQAREILGIDSEGVPWVRSPIHIGAEAVQRGAVPGYGEHTRAVLREIGYIDSEIDSLAAAGIVTG
ncbi:MAG: CoA transferase [Anaerolineae bacterium]|nr:CoA transferase [Anaerolineae bacterium]